MSRLRVVRDDFDAFFQVPFQNYGPDIPYVDGEKIHRRSVYFQHAYEKQMTMLVLFDAASRPSSVRERSSCRRVRCP